jgi:hypothetical protein
MLPTGGAQIVVTAPGPPYTSVGLIGVGLFWREYQKPVEARGAV